VLILMTRSSVKKRRFLDMPCFCGLSKTIFSLAVITLTVGVCFFNTKIKSYSL
jgi:hypothetical protein